MILPVQFKQSLYIAFELDYPESVLYFLGALNKARLRLFPYAFGTTVAQPTLACVIIDSVPI